jgi:hypothetical protein
MPAAPADEPVAVVLDLMHPQATVRHRRGSGRKARAIKPAGRLDGVRDNIRPLSRRRRQSRIGLAHTFEMNGLGRTCGQP